MTDIMVQPRKPTWPPITQHLDVFRCNHFWRRKHAWNEYGVKLIVCDACLKTIFHMIEMNAYWAARDAVSSLQEPSDG